MILNKKINNYLEELPFAPKVDKKTMKVSFSKGYIFNCYNNYADDDARLDSPNFNFSQGPSLYESEIQEYDFNYNDFFYLDSSATIFKLTERQREDYLYMKGRFGSHFPNYLIWKAPSNKNAGGEQVISENIFIQDKSSGQKKGFEKVVLKKRPDGSSKNRIYGGFVIVDRGHYQEFVKGIDYSMNKGENEKLFGLKVELSISISQLPTGAEDIIKNYISDYIITDVSLIELKGGEEDKSPTRGSPYGVYYFKLSDYVNRGSFYLRFSEFSAWGQVNSNDTAVLQIDYSAFRS